MFANYLGSCWPIILTSTIYEIFEGNCKYQTSRYYPLEKYISNKASRISTEELPAYFANSDSYSRHEHIFTIFSDTTKAFDIIWISRTWNITGPMLHFTSNFLHNKSFSVRVESTHPAQHSIQNGVLQGSVISTILFSIAYNNIVAEIKCPIKTALFTDDLVIFISCKFVITGEQVLQSTIDLLEIWLINNGLNFSPIETTKLHFCWIRGCNHRTNLQLLE